MDATLALERDYSFSPRDKGPQTYALLKVDLGKYFRGFAGLTPMLEVLSLGKPTDAFWARTAVDIDSKNQTSRQRPIPHAQTFGGPAGAKTATPSQNGTSSTLKRAFNAAKSFLTSITPQFARSKGTIDEEDDDYGYNHHKAAEYWAGLHARATQLDALAMHHAGIDPRELKLKYG